MRTGVTGREALYYGKDQRENQENKQTTKQNMFLAWISLPWEHLSHTNDFVKKMQRLNFKTLL